MFLCFSAVSGKSTIMHCIFVLQQLQHSRLFLKLVWTKVLAAQWWSMPFWTQLWLYNKVVWSVGVLWFLSPSGSSVAVALQITHVVSSSVWRFFFLHSVFKQTLEDIKDGHIWVGSDEHPWYIHSACLFVTMRCVNKTRKPKVTLFCGISLSISA